ncbi:kinase-like protein, partial [Amylocystis lapponica]
VRALGHGAFSSVWLARDVRGGLGPLELSRRTSLLRSRSERRGRPMKMDGTRPVRSGGVPMRREGQGREVKRKAEQPVERVAEGQVAGRLVAVKMTERALSDKNTRSRVSFVREVEILRHISHPSIVPFVHAFSTSSRHCLVLAHASGGELFELVSSPARHTRLRTPLLRRLFGELCKAVAWMHGVGLVHRDIKLENILLTADPLYPPPLPAPLVQLGDFGLARFIDPVDPLLKTLCGSESYAAPELAMARTYDGRATDAWACGVVLYALATRRLPFDRPRDGMSREVDETEGPSPPQPLPQSPETSRAERRAMLLRIAKAEYSWPDDADESSDEDAGLAGLALARSAGVRRVVGRLLVRDPLQRAAVAELWEDVWMLGKGAPSAPGTSPAPSADGHADAVPTNDTDVDEDEGVLVDGDDIGPGSVARQEH